MAYRHNNEPGILPEVSQQLFNDCLGLFDGVTEAPNSYHLFCFATAAGMTLERRIHIKYPHEIYPNLFCLLIGRSGYVRKESAIRFAKKLVSEVSSAQILSAIASWEGLLEAMPSSLVDDDGLKHEHTLIVLAEFDSLLKKARNESVSNLIPNLCEIYDCPREARTPTRNNPIKIDEPFVSILAGIQPEAVRRAFSGYDIHGGFCGRFMYVQGRAKKPNPWPDHVDSELLATLTVRVPDQTLKLAMIFAALDGQHNIEIHHLEDAIAIGKWLMDNTRQLFREFGQSEAEKIKLRIMEILKADSDGVTRRNIQRSAIAQPRCLLKLLAICCRQV